MRALYIRIANIISDTCVPRVWAMPHCLANFYPVMTTGEAILGFEGDRYHKAQIAIGSHRGKR